MSNDGIQFAPAKSGEVESTRIDGIVPGDELGFRELLIAGYVKLGDNFRRAPLRIAITFSVRFPNQIVLEQRPSTDCPVLFLCCALPWFRSNPSVLAYR